MDIPLDEVIHFDAIASSSTGAAVDADSTPTFAVYEEATDTDIGVGGNMTKRTSLTGNYRGSFTASAANGFEVGKWYNVIGSATIGGIATKGILKSFRIVAAEAIAGKPKADVDAWLGTAAATPTVAGVPEVDVVLHLGSAPNALQSGRYDSFVGAMGTDVFNAGAVAASAVAEWPTVAQIQSGLATQASVDTIDTEIGDLTTNLAALITTVGAAGAGLTEAGGTGDHLTALATAAALATVDSNVDAAKENTDYPDGYVYLDEATGGAGTTVGVNGTARNPAVNWASANTIAVARGRKAVKNAPGGTMNIASGTFDTYDIDINGGDLTLDDAVVITATVFHSTAKTGRIYETSLFGKVVVGTGCFLDNLFINGFAPTAAGVYVTRCGFYGDVVCPGSGSGQPFYLEDCYNAKTSGTAVDFDVTADGPVTLNGWSGDISLSNMSAGSTFTCYSYGSKLTIKSSCTGGTVKHVSHVEVVDEAGDPYVGAVTTELISEPTPLSTAGNLAVADAILDRSASTHTTNSTLGAIINDLEDGGRLDLLIDSILADTGTDGVLLATDSVNSTSVAASAGTELGTAVWASATRTLTALDEDSTTLDLDATIRLALGMAAATFDTDIAALPTAAEVTTDVFAQAVESGVSFLQAQRAIAAKAAGLVSGAGTGTEVFKGIGQSSGGTTRITATVNGAGDISAWTLNL